MCQYDHDGDQAHDDGCDGAHHITIGLGPYRARSAVLIGIGIYGDDFVNSSLPDLPFDARR